jgi:hypothetical protein
MHYVILMLLVFFCHAFALFSICIWLKIMHSREWDLKKKCGKYECKMSLWRLCREQKIIGRCIIVSFILQNYVWKKNNQL